MGEIFSAYLQGKESKRSLFLHTFVTLMGMTTPLRITLKPANVFERV